eukprot:1186752-Prorocentrum_minimum.AAC.1
MRSVVSSAVAGSCLCLGPCVSSSTSAASGGSKNVFGNERVSMFSRSKKCRSCRGRMTLVRAMYENGQPVGARNTTQLIN